MHKYLKLHRGKCGATAEPLPAENGIFEPTQTFTIHIGIVGYLASFVGALSLRFHISLWFVP
jgi:hypothetical protein